MSKKRPRLTIKQILAWADAHHRRTGRWPSVKSGRVLAGRGTTWIAIDAALKGGYHGLPGGSSVAKLLQKRRGRPNPLDRPRLTVKQILAWADAHHKRSGKWPISRSGPIADAPGRTWSQVCDSLRRGHNRLRVREPTTLTRLLRKFRGAQDARRAVQHLTKRQILQWADAHHKRLGAWPRHDSGRVVDDHRITWGTIHANLKRGDVKALGRTTLPRLLRKERGVWDSSGRPRLTTKLILQWADAQFRRTGRWPNVDTGRVHEATNEVWRHLDVRLRDGGRGLPGGTSLAWLLAKNRGVPHYQHPPRLTLKQILQWADAHYERTGSWPNRKSGTVLDAPYDIKWGTVNARLEHGGRGLAAGSSLPMLLSKRRGVRHPLMLPRLTHRQILAWAEAHYQRTGDWPSTASGWVHEAPHEKWSGINYALTYGRRGLRGGSSLVKLFSEHFGTLYRRKGLPLKRSQILDWATAHHELMGRLPTRNSGPVREEPGEMWSAIDAALRSGSRTLPGGSSLAELLKQHYVKPYNNVGQRLTTGKIITWAEAFRRRVGRWPTRNSAYVDPSRGEKWSTIDLALREGHRGLPGGSSLHKLLATHRRSSRRRYER